MIQGRPRREGAPTSGEDSEDADVVRAMYQALEERDAPAFARRADPRITWVHPLVTRLPFDGTRRGMQTVLRSAFRRDAADGTGPEVSAETFLEFGDGVLVAGRFLDGPVEKPFLHECFVRGGKVILIREYPA
jgi:ketosteroid isomerase-like protein